MLLTAQVMALSSRAIQVPPSSIRESYDLALNIDGAYRLFPGESNIGTLESALDKFEEFLKEVF